MRNDCISLTALDLAVTLSIPDPALRARVAELYSGCRVAPGASRASADLELDLCRRGDRYELRANEELCISSADRDDVLEWVVWKVNNAAVARERDQLVLHAAAAAKGGGAVLITGASGAGKSTIAAALSLKGFAYMGDDSLVIDARSHQIRSHPKPIALDPRSLRA